MHMTVSRKLIAVLVIIVVAWHGIWGFGWYVSGWKSGAEVTYWDGYRNGFSMAETSDGWMTHKCPSCGKHSTIAPAIPRTLPLWVEQWESD